MNDKEQNELVTKCNRLEKEKETLIKFILRHKPEMEDWIKMNFKEKENERARNT
jgi:hypothetical protein